MPLGPQDFREAAARRRKTKDVELEGFGTVRLRGLSAGEAVRFQGDVKKAAANGENEEELSFTLIARSLVGEDGDLLFPDEADGVALLRTLDTESFNALAKAVLSLNGMDKHAVENAEKN